MTIQAQFAFQDPSSLHLTLTQKQLCDLELILNGGFAPLTQFMSEKDYLSVLQNMRLADGTLWPMPIMLDVNAAFAEALTLGDEITLRDAEGLLLATMTVTESFALNREQEALALFGTTDLAHPGVNYLYQHTEDYYLAGPLTKIALPFHYDFTHLRQTPAELRAFFKTKKWEKIVAFQTRNPMHRAHQELTLRAASALDANILIHPVVGMTKPGDIDYTIRVRCYEHVLQTYAKDQATLSLLPLAMRMAGPKEALWHALIRKNYGCTHFIVGRDHAGPGKNTKGEPFYDPYAAQALTLAHQDELGITIVPFQEMVYSHQAQQYYAIDQFPKNETPASISGSELRDCLQKNADIPAWFSYPAVISELRRAHPLKKDQGFTVFFTGLPSSGKSTLANALALKLNELTGRQVSLLDGDIIRTHLSKGLGFSREDREANVTRVGFVAQEITKHGGIAICALVSPHEMARAKVREMVQAYGGFIEVYVATPLAVCEKRDRKGLYQKARLGLIEQFTGVNDAYEPPSQADITLNATVTTPPILITALVEKLQSLGYLT